jgi:hypothetical protein
MDVIINSENWLLLLQQWTWLLTEKIGYFCYNGFYYNSENWLLLLQQWVLLLAQKIGYFC